MSEPGGRDFEEFVRGATTRLFRTAYLLTGSRDAAADLLQTAFERTYARWPRIRNTDSPEAYARRVIVNSAIDRWRSRRRLLHVGLPRDTPAADPSVQVTDHAVLGQALATLSPRQRAAVVLRYYEDLSEAETARLLNCSTGAVKSHTARGLAALRDVLGAPSTDEAQTTTWGRPR